MDTDRLPHNTDTDKCIRQYAVDHNLHLESVSYIDLVTTCKDAPNMASINWLLPGQPVKRYNDRNYPLRG